MNGANHRVVLEKGKADHVSEASYELLDAEVEMIIFVGMYE